MFLVGIARATTSQVNDNKQNFGGGGEGGGGELGTPQNANVQLVA